MQRALIRLSVAVAVLFVGQAYADAGMYKLGCDQFTYDNVATQLSAEAPFGTPKADWDDWDISALRNRLLVCSREHHPMPEQDQALNALLRSKAAEFSDLHKAKIKQQLSGLSITERGERLTQMESARVEEVQRNEHEFSQHLRDEVRAAQDPRNLLTEYLKGTSFEHFVHIDNNSHDTVTTSPEDHGWVFKGNPNGDDAHCSLTIGFQTRQQHARFDLAPSLPAQPPVEQPTVPTGALILLWAKKLGHFSLALTKAGWSIPKGRPVDVTLDVMQYTPPAVEDPSYGARDPASEWYSRQLRNAFQQQMTDLNRQSAAQENGLAQGKHEAIDLHLHGTGNDVAVTTVDDPDAMVHELQDLATLRFAKGSEPDWVPRGRSSEAILAFSQCVSEASITHKAPPNVQNTQPF